MGALAKLLSKAVRKPDVAADAALVVPVNRSDVPADAEGRQRLIDQAGADVDAGRFTDALVRIDRMIGARPDDGELRFVRASTLFSWGRYWEASVAHGDAVRLGFSSSGLHAQRGWAAFWIGNTQEALAAMREAVAIPGAGWEAYFGLATVLRANGLLGEALGASKRAAELNPTDFHCLTALCATQVELGALEKAEALARRIIAEHPDNPLAWATLGGVLDHLNRFDESLAAYDRCEALSADSPEAADEYFNRVICLMRAGRTREALTVLERNFPDRANARAQGHYALALLTVGRLREGWDQYEFRWMKEPLSRARPSFVKPAWTGQELRGRTILLRTEQGHGDFIHFIRYARHVKALGATVMLAIREEMRPLVERSADIDAIVKADGPYPPFDFYANLMSLPRAFGTDLGSIPADVPYLSAHPDRVGRWSTLIPRDGKMNVGLVWAGSPTHRLDKFRSIRLEQLAPLAAVNAVRFFSLQKGPASAECTALRSVIPLVDLGGGLQDYGDTAAVISHLDLIISVDTSVAHLAGALAKPVWVLVANPADFRWMQDREDTPWYPTMRLFRQTRHSDWDEPIARVQQALRHYASSHVPSANGVVDVDPQSQGPTLEPANTNVRYRVAGLTRVAETRLGFMQYFPDQPGAGASLRRYGEYLHSQLMILAALGVGNRAIIEAGAGVGHHALWLAKALAPRGHLILYENEGRLRRVLEDNIASNGITNATVMRRTLRGPVVDNMPGPISGSGTTVQSECVDELRLHALDWLKIGEGFDNTDILAGATDTIWRTRPKLFIAASDAAAVDRLARHVRDFGYSCWRVSTPVFNPDNFNLCAEASPVEARAFALLATPEETGAEASFVECERLA